MVYQLSDIYSQTIDYGYYSKDSSYGRMLSNFFRTQGFICASHPWEVIVGTLTVTICMISMGSMLHDPIKDAYALKEEVKGLDAVVMTLRCLALLYIYHQFCKLRRLGSKYVLGIAGLFAVFSSLVFSSSVINFLKIDFAELNEAWPIFLLLIDLSKASVLAQLALSSSSHKEVRKNIAHGMAVMGPTMTLDTVVEALVIGVGTLSGVKRLEMACWFACTSVIVNYFVFMSFYPACLSLVLELSREQDEGRPVWQLKSLTSVLKNEEPKPNPVIQRVKVIMSAGLVLVHAHSRWQIILERSTMVDEVNTVLDSAQAIPVVIAESPDFASNMNKWLSASSDQVVMVLLALALAIKYVFFENKESLPDPYMVPLIAATDEHDYKERKCSFAIQDDFKFSPIIRKTSKRFDDKTVQTDAEIIPTKKALTAVDKQQTLNKYDFVEPVEQAKVPRPLQECLQLIKKSPQSLTDEEVMQLVDARHVLQYRLEWDVQDPLRGIAIRRKMMAKKVNCGAALENLPYLNYDYSTVMGACCENVIGYVPVPVGIAGPLLLDDKTYYVPMGTTEGCLVASTNRGCRALTSSGGVRSCLVADGMTRGPVVRFQSAQRAGEAMLWLNQEDNFKVIKESFDSTSRFARLSRIQVRVAARYLYIRFQALTGDAMGMNMLSKGSECALYHLKTIFDDMEIVSLSGNFCTDKKPSAVNWIEGRGKSVVCEAIVPAKIISDVLKTSVKSLIEKNIAKNLVGSAMAGSVGGFNAQAANIVTAIYIATGQDPAQNVTSSNCLTLMESAGEDGKDLYISVTMPSIEIGTVGGGTVLTPQASCLDILGVKGACVLSPGQNAQTLARIVCATVLAGELSLMSALASGDLVRSHLTHNRSQKNLDTLIPEPCMNN